jgi:hypothetical protein
MGLGMKIVIVKEDGSLERLPVARYNRLLQRDPDERQLQYADKRVRCAIIVFEVVDRRPVEILKSQYSYLSFDSEEYLWQPSSEIETAIRKAILGRPEGGRT